MINKTVSYYNNADDSRSKIRYNLDYVLGMIRDDQELFQQTVRQIYADRRRIQAGEEVVTNDCSLGCI